MREAQTRLVLRYMRQHGGITQAEAAEIFGCYRLSARIYDLRHEGVAIIAVPEVGRNRYGERVRYVRYALAPPEAMESR